MAPSNPPRRVAKVADPRRPPARRRPRALTWFALGFPLFFFLVIAGGIYAIKMGHLGLFVAALPHPPAAAHAPLER